MKYLALVLATGSLAFAQPQFETGQAARAVIGQPNFTRQQMTEQNKANPQVVGAVGGIAYANDTLIVVDSNRIQALPQNNRVLVYGNISGKLPPPRGSINYTGERCPVCGFSADLVLGQPDFSKTDAAAGRTGLRTPTGAATDGRVLAVADTDNNRVLIWHSMPTSINQPPDVVVGQPDFNRVALNFGGTGSTPSAQGLRGPQGVWIDRAGRLLVADTQNHRVLIWNDIPRENGRAADLVLGTPNFTTFVEVDLTQAEVNATASNLLNPVSVTTDPEGRVYVTDLGHNRVMIWNRFPTQNGQPGDVVLGQPDVASTTELKAELANNSRALCRPEINPDGELRFPALCAATLSFPRFALSDGTKLFVADGGNDRVLVWTSIPTRNGQPADVTLGQLADDLLIDSAEDRISSADSVRTPLSLAWDGVNLYVSDPFNRRVMVWTIADQKLAFTSVRNAASRDIYAVGSLQFTADPRENDEVTVKIGTGDAAMEYKYRAGANQTIANVIQALVELINAGSGNPLVFASPNVAFNSVILTARASGAEGNEVEVAMTFSAGAQLAGTATSTLSGGQDAAKIAPGSLINVIGENLADETATIPEGVNPLPTRLGGVEVYIDGIPAPLMMVSPTQITAQMPWEVNDASSVNTYVRIEGRDGQTRITSATAVPIIPENPGIFAQDGVDPRPAIVLHGSSFATGVVSVDGSVKENDVATVTINGRDYSYTVRSGDTLATIRDQLVQSITEQDEEVQAFPSSVFTRIILRARVEGKAGEGIPFSAKASDGANVIMTALNSALCCANQKGTPVTEANPAFPGSTIIVYATGLGFVQPEEAKGNLATGFRYTGPGVEVNSPNAPIDAIAGGKAANVLFAGLVPGQVGLYELHLLLNADIPTNPFTQLTIAQREFISNIVTFAVVNPNVVEVVP